MMNEPINLGPPPPFTQGFAIFQKFYPDDLCLGELARINDLPASTDSSQDAELLSRIIASYQFANEHHKQEASGVWKIIETQKLPVHEVIRDGDIKKLGLLLRDPSKTMLFHGFDQPTSKSINHLEKTGWLLNYRSFCLGALRRYAEAIAALSMSYPEGYGIQADVESNNHMHVNDLLKAIEARLGFQINFPNVFLNEVGLDTERGVASYRAIQSLYQGWRTAEVVSNFMKSKAKYSSALEIGGGTGRTAYFSFQMGVCDYSIVDLPLTGVVQAYFLGKSLGAENICLEGEGYKKQAIKIFTPPTLANNRYYNIATSFDSIVEFSEKISNSYIDYIRLHANVFLSGNRESKSFTVRKMLEARSIFATRTPHWLRQGYVEELAYLEELPYLDSNLTISQKLMKFIKLLIFKISLMFKLVN